MPANNPKQPEVKDAYAVVGEMLEYFDDYNLATWAPLASIVERERIAAKRATRERVLEEAARAIENRWRFSKASAAAIRAMKEEPKV